MSFAWPARWLSAVCYVGVVAAPLEALAADPVTYSVTIAPTGDAALDSVLKGSSQLVALRDRAPAGPFALVSRARQDIGRLRTALESAGYYEPKITVSIDGAGLDDAGLPDKLGALPAAQKAQLRVGIDTGPLFHLRRVSLRGSLPADLRQRFPLQPGAPAVASRVLGAGSALLTALQEAGYAMARVPPPIATEIPAAHALDVVFQVDTGPRVDLGAIAITGLKRTNERYVRRRLKLHPGELYQPSTIEAAREDLASTGIFQGVKISAAPALSPDGRLPLRVDVTERKRFTVALDAAFSTDLGGSAGVTWTERNLFGNAEQLQLTAEVTGLGGSDSTGEGYLAKAAFTKPDYYHRDQTLELDLDAIKQDLQSYDQTAEIASASLSRKLSKQWSVSVGVTATEETILQEEVTRDYTLLALPVTARFDSTNVAQPFDDPTHGLRATVIATPTESLSGQDATFFILQGIASTYVDLATLGLSKPGHTVLALRGLVGSVEGASVFQLPPDQRFYAGGSATLRGFKYQSVGPLFADGTPEGGTAIDAATIELRQRVWHNIGAVLFADAGQVDSTRTPFEGRLQEGVGVGARYYTAIGPLRLDFAVPVKRPRDGDSFEVYLGLGQAF
jgi:translocation and assembly module TamA